eukprot:TRINITY_DN1326_c0_g1_i7.p1 TRINITY_DN1326_c0_g1~~TRINITY_DN1326_c0_g1_i7.p1  ORF type:complete len:250 (-),score=-3.91 TRINITY_DN1326_c0_g1_i7:22-771(-)
MTIGKESIAHKKFLEDLEHLEKLIGCMGLLRSTDFLLISTNDFFHRMLSVLPKNEVLVLVLRKILTIFYVFVYFIKFIINFFIWKHMLLHESIAIVNNSYIYNRQVFIIIVIILLFLQDFFIISGIIRRDFCYDICTLFARLGAHPNQGPSGHLNGHTCLLSTMGTWGYFIFTCSNLVKFCSFIVVDINLRLCNSCDLLQLGFVFTKVLQQQQFFKKLGIIFICEKLQHFVFWEVGLRRNFGLEEVEQV